MANTAELAARAALPASFFETPPTYVAREIAFFVKCGRDAKKSDANILDRAGRRFGFHRDLAVRAELAK